MSKTSWKNQFVQIESSSQFHEVVRQVFCTSQYFSLLSCYQEVPVSDLIPSFENNRYRYDWYIEELHTILELHGEQHYRPTNRSGVSVNEALRDFRRLTLRDLIKKHAAQKADIRYVEVPYELSSKISEDILKTLLL